MKTFHKHMSINKTFSLMAYMFWMLLPTDGKTILAKVGSTVTLHCNDTSIHSLTQVTWKMNGNRTLFIYDPEFPDSVRPVAGNLSLSMSSSASQLYALIVERARESHTGNYTCKTTTQTGVWEQEWELLVTDSGGHPEDAGKLSPLMIVVIITVPCVTVLTFIIALTCMLTVCTHRAKNCTCSQPEDTHEQTEDIYENCFDSRDYIRPPQNKPRTY